MPDGWQLWLDGGHNAAAAAALADVLDGWRDTPVHLVAGMLRSRDPGPFLALLAPHVASARTVAIPGQDATLGADELAAAAGRAGIDATPAHDVAEAIAGVVGRPGGAGRILICGSLYLAGSVLADC